MGGFLPLAFLPPGLRFVPMLGQSSQRVGPEPLNHRCFEGPSEWAPDRLPGGALTGSSAGVAG